jgi:hypothetical protein
MHLALIAVGTREAVNIFFLSAQSPKNPYRIQRVLTVVYNSQNHWACGLCPSSDVLNM